MGIGAVVGAGVEVGIEVGEGVGVGVGSRFCWTCKVTTLLSVGKQVTLLLWKS